MLKKISRDQSLKILMPAYSLLYSCAFFLGSLFFMPLKATYSFDLDAMFFWIISILFFCFGSWIISRKNLVVDYGSLKFKKKSIQSDIRHLFILSVIGVTLLVIDRYLNRGLSVSLEIVENRDLLLNSNNVLLSTVAAVLSSFGIILPIYIFFAINFNIKINSYIKIISFSILILIIIINIQVGSRSLLLMLLLIYSISWISIKKIKNEKINIKIMLKYSVFILVFLLINAIIMAWRTEGMGISMIDSLQISGYSEMIQPDDWILEFIGDNGIISLIMGGAFSIIQYIYHGIYEFNYLFNNFQSDHTWGTSTFWLPIKATSILTGGFVKYSEFENFFVRSGIFNTFLGPIFIDFGLFSPIILFIFGMLATLPFRWLCNGNFQWLPTALIIISGVILWPVVNIFLSASGSYLLVISIFIALRFKGFNSEF